MPSSAGEDGLGPLSALVAREIEAMDASWRRGEPPRVEAILARHPELRDEDAVRLIFEEHCIRRDAGHAEASSEVLRRFPRWRSQLAMLFDCDRLLRAPTEADFPEAGEDLGDFRFLAEIGRGAQGRTFLAIQRSLADRPVVLKLTPLGHDEHLSLARLQHMHIVPLYFEQVIPDRDCRVLGMPYLGGTTLARIAEALGDVPFEQRSGRQILDAIDAYRAEGLDEPPTGGPFRTFLARATFEQAVCWIGACLADALQYAHDRGLIHMDVKASNVLIAGDGQPMLLDFHLARGPVGPGVPSPDRLGGTPDFMSPEQREAMADIRAGRPISTSVDGRSDIYSLGLLFDELLGGVGSRSSRRCHPSVSTGLSDIVRKCLAPDPKGRYADAATLAIDLRRHLNDQPMRGVANRSLAERWRKWRRRRPASLAHATIGLMAIASIVAGVAAWAVGSNGRWDQVEVALREGREHRGHRRFAEATRALRRALEGADGLQRRSIAATLRLVLREQTAADLHELVDLLRFRYGTSPPSAEEARSLAERIEEVWKRRGLLAEEKGDPPALEVDRQVRIDFLDLATVWADLVVNGGSRGRPEGATGEAVAILAEAERQFGPGPALRRDLRRYGRAVGRDDLATIDVPPPRTAWEHYDLGRSYLRSGDHALAEGEFRRSAELEPGEYWPHFFQGLCAYRLGRPREAAGAFSICIALAPRTAESYYNRAKSFKALGESDRAEADALRARELNPGLTASR